MASNRSWADSYFGPHYLAIYSSHLLSPVATLSEADFAFEALALPDGARVLDVPCGFGRHMGALACHGLRLFGADLKFPYLRHARQSFALSRLALPPLAAADMAHLPFKGTSFDAVVNLFTSFGYYPDSPAAGPNQPTNRGVLGEFARVLRPGGLFLIDLPERDALVRAVRSRPSYRCAGEGWEIFERFSYDPATRTMNNETRFTVRESAANTGYALRLYSRREMEKELETVGLEPVAFWGEMRESAREVPDSRIVILAKKTIDRSPPG